MQGVPVDMVILEMFWNFRQSRMQRKAPSRVD